MARDPLVAAGHAVCSRCGAIGWPADAIWLDEGLILALYAPGCDHVPERLRLIRPSELRPEGRCIGTTVGGARCSQPSSNGQWCAQHAPERESRS